MKSKKDWLYLILTLVIVGFMSKLSFEDEVLAEASYCNDVEAGYYSNYKNIDCERFKK